MDRIRCFWYRYSFDAGGHRVVSDFDPQNLLIVVLGSMCHASVIVALILDSDHDADDVID